LPINEVCRLIDEAIHGKMFGNLHFFVNSVEFIADALTRSGLTSEQVRIVCSNNSNPGKGKKTNQRKLGDHFRISTTTDEVKLVNFYTSTCFEGCDIYDENGRTYIVSDKYKSYTLLDISTLIIQICGRIRNSRYNTEACHIFSETRYNKFVTLDEFKAHSENQVEKAKSWICEVNKMNSESRNITIQLIEKNNKSGLNEMYIFKQGDKLHLDENLIKLDIVNFKITHHIYSSRIILADEYRKYGFDVSNSVEIIFTDKLLANSKARVSFEQLFVEYAKLKKEIPLFFFGNMGERISLIEQEKPLVKEAYEILGEDRVKALRYNVSNIKRAIIGSSMNTSTDNKILQCLHEIGVQSGTIKTSKEWKEILQSIYEALVIKETLKKFKSAKATDLEQWFEVKKTTPKIDGKTTDCFTIIKPKLLYI